MPRPAKYHMAGMHRNNITTCLIFVLIDEEVYHDLLAYLYFTVLIQPLQLVGVGISSAYQSKSFHKQGVYHIGVASSIDVLRLFRVLVLDL